MELSSTRVLFDNNQTITVNSRNTVNQYYMFSLKRNKVQRSCESCVFSLALQTLICRSFVKWQVAHMVQFA